jgi:hypothetical protein
MAEVRNTSGDTRLRWSIAAMNDACERLGKGAGTDLPGALGPADRRATEGTFTGLPFVRGWIGYHAAAYR